MKTRPKAWLASVSDLSSKSLSAKTTLASDKSLLVKCIAIIYCVWISPCCCRLQYLPENYSYSRKTQGRPRKNRPHKLQSIPCQSHSMKNLHQQWSNCLQNYVVQVGCWKFNQHPVSLLDVERESRAFLWVYLCARAWCWLAEKYDPWPIFEYISLALVFLFTITRQLFSKTFAASFFKNKARFGLTFLSATFLWRDILVLASTLHQVFIKKRRKKVLDPAQVLWKQGETP